MSLKKYVPRSIQNIFDRLEAFNESITEKLFSEELVKTFEVIVYCSKNPETKTTVSADSADLSPNVANYNFFKARSLAGHHDFLIQPERARSIDEYERLRNLHFQAVIKKSSGGELPQTGDVWLATQTGANMVSLISFQRSGNPQKYKIPEETGPAQKGFTGGNEPTNTVADYSNSDFGESDPNTPEEVDSYATSDNSTGPIPLVDATQRKLLDFISKGEGSYNASNNGTRKEGSNYPSWFVNSIGGTSYVAELNVTSTKTTSDQKLLSTLTIGEIKDFQGWTGNKNTCALNQTFSGRRATRTLFAVGAYQIIPKTMPVAILDSGLSESDTFSPDNQDKLGLALIYGRKRPRLRDYLKGSSSTTLDAAQSDFAHEWASIPMPNGKSAYESSGNRAGHTSEEVRSVLKEVRALNIENGFTV